MKNFVRGIRALKKRRKGPGNWNGFDFDDALRIALAKELLRVGLQVASIDSLFQSIEKDWPRLRRPESRAEGAALVLVLGHPLGPDPERVGHGYLTTAYEAKRWLESTNTVIVIDVNAMIAKLEDATGTRYDAPQQEQALHPSKGKTS